MLNRGLVVNLGDEKPPLEVSECLYYFDEPLIFLSVLGFDKYLFIKVDEADGVDTYIASIVDQRTIDLVKSGKLSVRGALSETVYAIFSAVEDFSIESVYRHHISEVDERFLPKSGMGISHEFGWCSDFFPKSQNFTVRLFGGNLDSKNINLRYFKNLVEKFQDVVRAAYVPHEYDDPKRKSFSFDMAKPEFGSLVLSVDEPEIIVENIVEFTGDENIDEAEARNRVEDEFSAFFSTIHDAFHASSENDGKINNARLKKDKDSESDLMAIRAMLPSANSLHSGVEFYGLAGGNYQYFRFERDQSEKLSSLIDDSFIERKNVAGEIEIINVKSGTFVIKPDQDKRLTCQMNSEIKEQFFANRDFKIGAKVSVFGDFQKRKVRDIIFLETTPIILG